MQQKPNWTPEQLDAIEARGGTVLVSAAAGSGKTAVLVERVIGRILDPDNPVDANRLLVVTFSNAAAMEMKQRIMKRISGLIAENPEDEYLQRQQVLLTQASISTIHSFCIDLIRSNFQLLGISSNVRVADEKELEIIRRDCAAEAVEVFHQNDEEGLFAQLVELLSSGRDDRKVFSTLFSLYDFVRSHAFYENWLDQKLAFYSDAVLPGESIWGASILAYAADALAHAKAVTRQALDILHDDEAMVKAYHGALSSDLLYLEQFEALVQLRDWDGICAALGNWKPVTLGRLKGNESKKEAVKTLRESVKDTLKDLRDKQFCATSEEYADDMRFLQPLVGKLFDLAKEFDRLFKAAKQERNLMDFSDMEHYAIALLVRQEGPGYSKTPLAESVGALYDEILIDEFQDTNAAQELIFRAVSRSEENLFMVGDVKQSIYRFRQAMPELFMQKKKDYQTYDGRHFPATIILGRNFRSAAQVTAGVNYFFEMLMSEKVGEIDYNEQEALTPAATFPAGEYGCKMELLDISGYTGERDSTAVEAQYVADRIAGMLESGLLVTEKGVQRRIRPGDICILLRSPAKKAQKYQDALTRLGVPVWSAPQSRFLTTREIAPVISLLRIIENPLLDIDLAAAMMSALFGFTADEMAEIRIGERKAPLYLAVYAHAQAGDMHCKQFLEILDQLRYYAGSAPADAVIRKIYELTDYIGKVQVMRMGYARRANLLRLVDYAAGYHQNGMKGTGGFIGFVDRLLERDGDLEPAVSLSEQADVVRIMSIHRSKGLEFPVVFLCDCAKKFNKMDLRSNALFHSELGFACMRRDFAHMQQFTTVPMQALRLESERSMLSEELRMLYVALTRAKEQMIITGLVEKPEKKLPALISEVDEARKLSFHLVRGAGSFLDWMLMAAVHHPACFTLLRELGVEPLDGRMTSAELAVRMIAITEDEVKVPAPAKPELAPDEAEIANWEQHLSYQYPHLAQTQIPAKMAVSQIAKGDMAKSYRFARRPAFMLSDGVTGAQRGNLLHKFMQFADYERAKADIGQEIERLTANGYFMDEEAKLLSKKKLQAFFSGPLAARIFASGKVYRELRFLAEVGRELLGEYSELFAGSGKTAVQGVADCVFIEDGKAVIVDYKSDYVKTPQELVDRYKTQLVLYAKVLSGSLEAPVGECVIYSFSLSREITVTL